MTEKLIIKNFAGINELEIEVKKINILIGPETSGKSICAKLLFYFKDFLNQFAWIIETGQTLGDLEIHYSRKFIEYFPVNTWTEDGFYIKYEISDCLIEIRRNEKDILLNYSNIFKMLFDKCNIFINETKKIVNNSYSTHENIDKLFLLRASFRNFLVSEIKSFWSLDFTFFQLFIPSGRSFFAILQSNIFSLLSTNLKLDPFLVLFGSSYESFKNSLESIHNESYEEKEESNVIDEIKKLIEQSLRAKYIRNNGKDFLNSIDGRQVNIANSSSGQQELLPLTVIFEALPLIAPNSLGYTVYVEEPEAHLFPNTQRNIIELMATVFNSCEDKLQLFITTHSPYVLTAVNNLLQAGQLYETADEDTQKKLEEIIPKYKSLKTADVAAYSLSKGRCQNIINPETGLIDAQIIDLVSEELIVQFDNLLDFVEPNNEEID